MLIQPEPQGLWELTPRLNHTLETIDNRVNVNVTANSSYSEFVCERGEVINLIVFSDHPDHAHSDSHVKSFHLLDRRLHLDPGCAWQRKMLHLLMVKSSQNLHNSDITRNMLKQRYGCWPVGLSRVRPVRTSRFPSHSTAHSRSPGPADNWATSLGTSTSSHPEPSGTRGLMPSLNHTCRAKMMQ